MRRSDVVWGVSDHDNRSSLGSSAGSCQPPRERCAQELGAITMIRTKTAEREKGIETSPCKLRIRGRLRVPGSQPHEDVIALAQLREQREDAR